MLWSRKEGAQGGAQVQSYAHPEIASKYGTLEGRHMYGEQPSGLPGALLFQLRGSIRWHILVITVYALACIGVLGFVMSRPSLSSTERVLPSGGMRVDPFYSGLLLSVLLTPAAISIRTIATELALLHPFAVAAARPVAVADLDLMTEGGIHAALRLFKYDRLKASVQTAIIVIGAVLVPIGTLLVTTGAFSPQIRGLAVAGVPGTNTGAAVMGDEMLLTPGETFKDFNEFLGPNDQLGDYFLSTAREIFAGRLIQSGGILAPTAPEVGPLSTTNITFIDGVRYGGIVTYSWSSNCFYTDDPSIDRLNTGSSTLIFNLTLSNGASIGPLSMNDSSAAGILLKNAQLKNGTFLTYFIAYGRNDAAVNFDTVSSAHPLWTQDGTWIMRMACEPEFKWKVSSCTWQNSTQTMTECLDDPDSEVPNMDYDGLNTLHWYMKILPRSLHAMNYFFGGDPLSVAMSYVWDQSQQSPQMGRLRARIPVLRDIDNIYGVIAQSVASSVSSGYYGTAEVPTYNQPPQPVYIVRTYIMAILVVLLVLCPVLAVAVIITNLSRHIPLRKVTLLTGANATRGPNWDYCLTGGSVMSDQDLRKRYEDLKVMYGVDAEMPDHVGFAEVTQPVRDEEVYL